ncbi:paired immunoglobulin-like type 2 receptor beta [Sorex fumeus]|uniref:paired immunoglobulin-like type 2 receptor beta n=1 Tax=Sorex fumeus TaxID=62283 RepID=UPI0024AE5DD9|nr:paired immunoglobulin-like type 2 receptor beta [Sorex fumeus]
MGLALLLLLPLLASLLDAAPEDCGNGNFGMDQPEHLTASKGGAVCIPCSFHHSWELAEILEVNIDWRRKQFRGDFIYDMTLNWTHEEFKGRVCLDWTQGQTRGALLIWNLLRGDATMYFCQVTLQTKIYGPRRFQLFRGTNLSITPAQPDAGLDMTNSTQSSPLTLDTMVVIMVIVTLLKMTILGLISYLVWKRSQGS